MSTGSDQLEEGTAGWEGTDETVRDLARAMIPGANEHPASQTVDDMRLLPQFQAAPGVGYASDLAQPGGFRRVHVLASVLGESAASEYAQQPLVTTLLQQGRTGSFITDLVQVLEDGTSVRFESRPYRRGRKPRAVLAEGGPAPPPTPLRFCGFRPYSVPYWVSLAFLFGAILFTLGSLDWMLPYVGDVAHGAPMWAYSYSTAYPFFLGGLAFILGCYLSFVEVINANLGEEIRTAPSNIDQSGSVHRPGSRRAQLRTRSTVGYTGGYTGDRPSVPSHPAPAPPPHAPPHELLHAPMLTAPPDLSSGSGLRWVAWQPRSLLYWGAVVQLVSALVFQVSCYAGLPGVIQWWAEAGDMDEHTVEVYGVYLPCVLGSVGFVFATYVYVVEVTHDYNIFRRPPPEHRSQHSLGYGVARLNLLGSILFLVASVGYFVQAPPYEYTEPWEHLVSLWGVRFPFAAGSACFIFASILMLPESLSD